MGESETVNRITARLASRGKDKLLIPFFTAGYPSLGESLDMVLVAEEAGADMVELGMPFSDPLADGPQIQHTSHLSLARGTELGAILKGVEKLRRTTNIPLILMGYLNPPYVFGFERFLQSAALVGVDGLIIPDLPFDEASEFRRLARRYRISAIFLVAPTTSNRRLIDIDKACSDFVYAVTVTGVTGVKTAFDTSTDAYLRRLRRSLSKPFVAGFGIDSAASARRMVRLSDGVVIGSALVRLMRSARTRKTRATEVAAFLKAIRKAL
jgi:tryptophan synthase alpha chain